MFSPPDICLLYISVMPVCTASCWYAPTARALPPPFRKGLRGQKKLCLFQSLRNAESIGKYNAAGLPGIVGRIYNGQDIPNETAKGWFLDGTGALYEGPLVSADVVSATSVNRKVASSLNIDASRSNIHYGASDTVMPSSVDISIGIYLGMIA